MTDCDLAAAVPLIISMIRAVCFELANTPIYCVDANLLGKADGHCTGIAAPDLDLLIRPYVDWHGPGIAVIYSPGPLERSGISLLAIVCHEVSHCLREGYLDRSPEVQQPGQTAALVKEVFAHDFVPAVKTTVAFHDDKWHRTVLHMRHRLAWTFDLFLGVHEVIGYDGDTLPINHSRLHEALLRDGEYDRLAHLTIAELLTVPPPAAFTAQWESDLAEFFAEQRSLEHQTVISTQPIVEDPMNLLTTFLDKISRKQKELEQIRIVSFRDLAQTVAVGKEPPVDDATRILREAGKSSEDLMTEVQRLLRRKELQGTLTKAKLIDSQRQQVNDAIAKADADLEAAKLKRDQVVDPLIDKLRAMDQLHRDAKSAEGELLQTVDDSLKEQWASACQRSTQLAKAKAEARGKKEHAELAHESNVSHEMGIAKRVHEQSRWATKEDRNADLSQLAAQFPPSGVAVQMDERLQSIDAEMAAVESEVKALRQRMLEA